MPDYLQPVGDGVRRFAAVACLVASFIAAAVTGLAVFIMIQQGRIDHNGKPVWVGAVVCGLIAAASALMTVRLWGGRSTNGVTVLPVWFIEVFGFLFLIGMLWIGIQQGWIWGTGGAIGVAVSMLLVRRAIRRHEAAAE